MASLGQLLIVEGTLAETLLKVAEVIRDALFAEMSGITMLVDGRLTTEVFTDPTAADIDSWQYQAAGRGPCVDAFHERRTFRIEDTATDIRWPEFAAAAQAHGVASTLSLPLSRHGASMAAMNVYAREANHFSPDTSAAEELAGQASVVLMNAAAYHDAKNLNENLNQALVSRRTIDYAIGLLMSAGGRSPDDAFRILVRASQRENRKLREIATEIVDAAANRRHIGPDPAVRAKEQESSVD